MSSTIVLVFFLLGLVSAASHLLPQLIESCDEIYIIKQGDTALKIAHMYNLSLETLLQKNKNIVDPDLIFVDQRLCVSGGFISACDKSHTVKKDDLCYVIASQNDISLEDLLKINPHIDCMNLEIGQHLCTSIFKDEDRPTIVDGEDDNLDDEGSSVDQNESDIGLATEPGSCYREVSVGFNETCAEIATVNSMNVSDIISLNPEVCCGNIKTNETLCVYGVPHTTEVVEASQASLNETECPLELRTGLTHVNGTSIDAAKATDVAEATSTITASATPESDNKRKAQDELQEQPPRKKPRVDENRGGDSGGYLSAHNNCRSRSSGGRIAPLSWDGRLASEAQRYASVLASYCSWNPNHSGVAGENMYWSSGGISGSAAVGSWCSEPLVRGMSNHHSQVVWDRSHSVGCGEASCGAVVYAVCRYWPPGNNGYSWF